MSLAELLEIRSGVTAVIGGGGKTALLRTLGEELSRGGARVLLCASAKIFPFAGLTNLADPTEAALAEALRTCGLVCAGTPVPSTGKFAAPGIPMIRLAELADYVLAEADGSAGRPLKAHAGGQSDHLHRGSLRLWSADCGGGSPSGAVRPSCRIAGDGAGYAVGRGGGTAG